MSLLVALASFRKLSGVGIVAGEHGLKVDRTSPQDGYMTASGARWPCWMSTYSSTDLQDTHAVEHREDVARNGHASQIDIAIPFNR